MSNLRRKLEGAPESVFVLYASLSAFVAYFAMYAFRKPFAAAVFDGQTWFGSEIGLKAALAGSQLIGYAASKIIGIKVCSELKHARRGIFLIGVIVLAEATLLVYGAVPDDWKFLAITVNGLLLGVVWGVVVTFLEGRRTSEILLAVLSCSFIMASGIVKDFGQTVMNGTGALWWHGTPLLSPWLVEATGPVSEGWMPFVVGLHYLPVFIIAVILLKQLPEPSEAERLERSSRPPMDRRARFAFFSRFAFGIVALCLAYLFLTAYRDFRDTYQIDIFALLGYADDGLLGRSETVVAFAVTGGLALLYWLRTKFHRNGLGLIWGFMSLGIVALAGGTWLFLQGGLTGFQWMISTGIGVYLCYVPFGSVLFDEIIANTRFAGTAVFAIYLCDGVGYVGAVALYFLSDMLFGDLDKLQFFIGFTWTMATVGALGLITSYIYFRGKARAARRTWYSPGAPATGYPPK